MRGAALCAPRRPRRRAGARHDQGRRRGLLVAVELRAADLAWDLEPGVKVEHFLEDLGVALSEAQRMNLSLPGTALAEQLYVAAAGHGLGTKGTQALAIALSRLSADRWPAGPDTSGAE